MKWGKNLRLRQRLGVRGSWYGVDGMGWDRMEWDIKLSSCSKVRRRRRRRRKGRGEKVELDLPEVPNVAASLQGGVYLEIVEEDLHDNDDAEERMRWGGGVGEWLCM